MEVVTEVELECGNCGLVKSFEPNDPTLRWWEFIDVEPKPYWLCTNCLREFPVSKPTPNK